VELLELKWPDVAALPKDTPIVIPVAALEQHGRHLPVFTDSLLLGEVLRRAKQLLHDRVLFTPLMWLGNSEHHLDFPGSMSASPRAYLDLLKDMAENFLFHGFRRIVIVNGHGGNIVPAQQALFELRQKYRQRDDLLLLSATYWTLGAEPHKVDPNIKQQQMGHACEWETSMMLRLRPELVGDLTKVEPVELGNRFAPAHRAWITRDRTAPGHIGDPRFATAEKGETMFRVFTAGVVAFLERVLAWDGKGWDA
jgi:creatinine amidohydrolase